jgi:hypothetical protein
MTTTAPTLRDLAMQHGRDVRMATVKSLYARLEEMEQQASTRLLSLLSTISNGHLTDGTFSVTREPGSMHALTSRVRLAVPGDDLVLWQEVQVYDHPDIGPDSCAIDPLGSVPCPTCKTVHVHEIAGLVDLYSLYTVAAQCCGGKS